jgi:hypothetical protein
MVATRTSYVRRSTASAARTSAPKRHRRDLDEVDDHVRLELVASRGASGTQLEVELGVGQ